MIFRLTLVLSILFLSACGMSNPFDDNIPYKTRFDDGLSFFEEAKYVKASQQFNIIVERASHTDLGDDALFFLAESYFLNKDYELVNLKSLYQEWALVLILKNLDGAYVKL